MWLDPYPDALLEEIADSAPGPELRATRLANQWDWRSRPRYSICRPRQRAALVLREVLGFQTSEVA